MAPEELTTPDQNFHLCQSCSQVVMRYVALIRKNLDNIGNQTDTIRDLTGTIEDQTDKIRELTAQLNMLRSWQSVCIRLGEDDVDNECGGQGDE